jgi:hypothetical protein
MGQDGVTGVLQFLAQIRGVSPLKRNGCKTDGQEWDLLPLAFLRPIR